MPVRAARKPGRPELVHTLRWRLEEARDHPGMWVWLKDYPAGRGAMRGAQILRAQLSGSWEVEAEQDGCWSLWAMWRPRRKSSGGA